MWQPGKTNGEYTIEKMLGEGGFGITYLAKNKQNKQVVIKTINDQMQNHQLFDKFRRDFYNEALRLAKCTHPHIVNIIELIETDGLPCIVMEYIPGENLHTCIDENHVSEAESLLYIRQIGEALKCVHQVKLDDNQYLLHRDVKPLNIIIRNNKAHQKEAVLIDFGISRMFNPDEPETVNTIFESPGFTPIEQCYGKQGFYTDVYALAATLYYCLTKKYLKIVNLESICLRNNKMIP